MKCIPKARCHLLQCPSSQKCWNGEDEMEMMWVKSNVLHLEQAVKWYPRIPLWYTANSTQQGQGLPVWPQYVMPNLGVLCSALRTYIPSSLAYPASNWVQELTLLIVRACYTFLERSLLSLDRNWHPLISFTTSLGFTFGIFDSQLVVPARFVCVILELFNQFSLTWPVFAAVIAPAEATPDAFLLST